MWSSLSGNLSRVLIATDTKAFNCTPWFGLHGNNFPSLLRFLWFTMGTCLLYDPQTMTRPWLGWSQGDCGASWSSSPSKERRLDTQYLVDISYYGIQGTRSSSFHKRGWWLDLSFLDTFFCWTLSSTMEDTNVTLQTTKTRQIQQRGPSLRQYITSERFHPCLLREASA